ncbi:orotate phosphoribosyltransferase-like protein [Halobaculum sp. CBA1158]|uniref:transcriptional regulator GfcR n=1 Tax=Halobaculum sp. CBA1158 TaxID=2904243 RepID=UPI001F27DA11|nr:transcriptional regulator GfcR [Halobaculum sp. CBA1158]UIO98442.1 orotate phosphoribosyltransferase-like protein [Halobaculum sp. CBA1158]
MKNVDDLIDEAAELAGRGLSKGEIADELNVSRETASWLVDRSGAQPAGADDGDDGDGGDRGGPAGPQDIHVDWSTVGRDSTRLTHVGSAMADLLAKEGEAVDLTVGIEKAGTPLATTIARELDTDLAAYAPAKHQWDEGDLDQTGGGFSRNFATIRGRECYVVDDTVTSGTTLTETVEAVKAEGGQPRACVVIVDKQGLDEVDGVPVYSLINVVGVGRD